MDIRVSRPDEAERLLAIWRAAVDATHDFLSPEDRVAIDRETEAYLLSASPWVAVDADDRPVGFLCLAGAHLDSLFIHPLRRGAGVGRQLVNFAASMHPALTTEVNAQNAQALGFYRRMGFVETGRTSLDDQGRPYPLIRMRLDARRGALRKRA